ERARHDSVLRLKKAAKKALGGDVDEEEEDWVCVRVRLPAEARAVVDEAERLAGQSVGMASPRWERAVAFCEEFSGSHEPASDGGAADALLAAPASEFVQAAEEWVESQREQWAFLERPELFAAPGPLSDDADVRRLHQELRLLAERRERWDEVFGHLAMIFLE